LDDERKVASDRLRKHLDGLSDQVEQIDPCSAYERSQRGAQLVDIREPHELELGMPAGALAISRGMLELEIGNRFTDPEQPMILVCAGGDRSLLSACSLQQLGYRNVANLAGGFNAWQAASLPIEQLDHPGQGERTRYLRHLAIPEVGEAGQARLLKSHVAIVGAGGLGSPAALYLAAAGVGCLTLIDADRVERSNLQRQILHSDHLIGHLKTESAAQRLHALNPEIEIRTHAERLDRNNAERLIADAEVVVDGSDNFPTRYLLNDTCISLDKPLVYAAVLRFSGQVAVFPGKGGPCYRCLFPEPPRPEDAPNCAEAGVLGVMPGVMGCLQAAETLKLLLGIGQPLIGRLLHYDALTAEFRTTRLIRDPACQTCGT
jgi:sulfur-carrier protein adenylyltransferase/sulfurtransferase